MKAIILSMIVGVVTGVVIYCFHNGEYGFIELYKWWEKIVFIWIFASIAEEFLISGFVQSYISPVKTITINFLNIAKLSLPMMICGIVFAIMYYPHFVGKKAIYAVLILIPFLIMGVVKAYYREKSDSILAPILAHFIFSAALSGSIYLIVKII